ncbi:MAG: hypothetical protein H6657_04205 [Ardenticatenaceae bacterium]|nr:hypothetical protein [Ardenticatenaceae bacterium]
MFAERIRKTNVLRHPAGRMALAAAVLLLAVSLFANLLGWGSQPADGLSANFQLLARIDLSRKTWQEEPVAEFSLDDSARVTLYFSLRNVNAAYFDLALSGPDGFQALILHSETYRTDDNGAGWEREFSLLPGDYHVLLTAPQNPGTLAVYWNRQ